MHKMKNLTTSVYTFEKLIEGGYSYIDKTNYIWNLIKEPYGIYFLSRPRRFGKSLTLSTLKAVFQNKKHLFKGLALTSAALTLWRRQISTSTSSSLNLIVPQTRP